jgi:two-component system phosphate regulon sensor histidine kinase PhoR
VSASQPLATNDNEKSERNIERAGEFAAVLLAMAGHDLRQPLQVISSTYDRLASRLDTSAEWEYLQRGRLAIAQLVEQLDHLIDASRLYERAGPLQPAAVQLAPLLAGICHDNNELARQKKLRIDVLSSRTAVMSDAVLLDGVLRNLIRNAIKYTPSGGRILVGCRQRGPIVRIEVHDTGIGIPPGDLSRIFEAFHRIDTAYSDGLGLGLFIVRRAVDLLGHHVDVRSTVGRGSCFSILANAASPVGPACLQETRTGTATKHSDQEIMRNGALALPALMTCFV